MIPRSTDFNLGLDTTRMKDPRDAQRQHRTVDELLSRLYHDEPADRRELQILADEVGMGKTFVALGVAYSVLAQLRRAVPSDDMRGCYRKVVVVTPQNQGLFRKWKREVDEFVRRCVAPESMTSAGKDFSGALVERLDDLVAELRKNSRGANVLIINTGIFAGGKFLHYDLKRRILLGSLFRLWGNGFRNDRRDRLLRGAPDGWSRNPKELTLLTPKDLEKLPFESENELYQALCEMQRDEPVLQKVFDTCKELSELYTRDRTGKFRTLEQQLNDLYRHVIERMITKAFPLVIVDEAHNWKNGREYGTNGYVHFRRILGQKTRRMLLLTATPFQLRPEEVLSILAISDDMAPTAQSATLDLRRQDLRQRREDIIRPVLRNSDRASRSFSKAWTKLNSRVTTEDIETAWNLPQVTHARDELRRVAGLHGVVLNDQIERIVNEATIAIDPEVRGLLRQALNLYAYNSDLSQEMGQLVVRHRRRTDHRLFRVGSEYGGAAQASGFRPDSHILHGAVGMDVRGPAELPHYLLMRCVTEMKNGKGRSSLGANLTGCYSTLLDSAEGKGLQKELASNPRGAIYADLLMRVVGKEKDPQHPKVAALVEQVLENWRAGEKTLIFCFRTNTSRRLRDIIDKRIREELETRRDRCLGGKEGLRALRGRLTGRERDLIPIGLDRVLWSMYWATVDSTDPPPFAPDELRLSDADMELLTKMAQRYGLELADARVDRVFLTRTTEHLLARRFQKRPMSRLWQQLLADIASEDWIQLPYGVQAHDRGEEGSEESTAFDERGVHTTYREATADSVPVETTSEEVLTRRANAARQNQTSVFDVYAEGPNLWLGKPIEWENSAHSETLRHLHQFILRLTYAEGCFDWQSRLLTFQALRRALLRESVLLRLLPAECDREESGWGELLVEAFFSALPNQQESMADKIVVFLEDLQAASGNLQEKGSQRFVLYDSTNLRDHSFVALVDGGTKPDVRERIFAGFNTPLLPEVLVCTSVGQEGIDLHRHCRHVVHYDLAWNPAVLEQRTGRTDRIGSKTFRERARHTNGAKTPLEIGVPFLAGTYDERMYEELRIRSQTFEVLTGGDLAADNAEGAETNLAEEHELLDKTCAVLPQKMVEDLRVHLEVWCPPL